MDKIPEIDKEILGRFFSGYKYEQYEAAESNNVRAYKIDDKDISLMIIEKEALRFATELFMKLMLLRKDIHSVITNYDEHIVIITTKSFVINILLEEPYVKHNSSIEDNAYFDEESDEDDSIAFTNGKWSPCPYCGSKRISTFMDGTAQCDECKRVFRYM
jgi:hypothetical protein